MRTCNDIPGESSPGWYKWLMENPYPRTPEQVAYFRRKFPDAKGEVLMMMILWPMELKKIAAVRERT